jgi:hypothetical protein
MEHDYLLKFYNDIKKIYAICFDLNISDDKTRLLTYIHIKICENEINYFDNPKKEEIQALIMLLNPQKIMQILKDENLEQEQLEIINNSAHILANLLVQTDIKFANEYGLENRISSEFKYRLLLYTDPNFKKQMIDLYTNEIKTKLHVYDDSKINDAFSKYQKKYLQNELEFRKLLSQ